MEFGPRKIAIEFSERLSYFGIATSLVIYLTKVIHQDLKTAVKNVNYWAGVTTLMPLFGGFLADAYLGRYTTVIASCIVYLMGLVLLSLSWFLPGTGGHKPSLESFGADQFDDDHVEERRQKMSFFNWWNCGLCSGLILGVTIIVYVQDHVNWGVADIILTVVMAFSLLIFLIGRSSYRYRAPTGSPLTPMFLDKAAIVENEGNLAEKQSPWRLATVTKIGNGFEIPPASIFTLAAIGMIVSVAIYDKILVPVLRRINGNERGMNILQRIGFGMLFSVITMVVAALVERKRLEFVEMNPSKGSLSMSVFWLAPQFLIIGFGKNGKGWIGKDLNSSRLDKFYWLLATITTMNLFVFVFFARQYSYKNVQKVVVADCYEGKSDEGGAETK
ncbi:Proton-dependent oligopeptide transporter family, partial [Sesbania bispinosa]